VPLKVSTTRTFASVDPGSTVTCALDASAAAFCWGTNDIGQVGDSTHGDAAAPTAVAGNHTFEVVSGGLRHSCGNVAGGAAYCWGDNSGGQLGLDSAPETCHNFGCSSVPTAVTGGRRFRSIGAGSFHTCALTATGAAHCWGSGGDGQLGNGSFAFVSPIPVPVSGNLRFAQLSVGWFHACGVTTRGGTFCWGWNQEGPLGNGTTEMSATPTPVLMP
jgi:alpha-tubulin suppressor-like RCC1 family protein